MAGGPVDHSELERVMSDWTPEDDRKAAESKVVSGKCDGSCRPHSGTPRLVEVEGWGFFSYCDEAIAEDGRRGIALTVIDGGDSAAQPGGYDNDRA